MAQLVCRLDCGKTFYGWNITAGITHARTHAQHKLMLSPRIIGCTNTVALATSNPTRFFAVTTTSYLLGRVYLWVISETETNKQTS